jgi:hypothetical protein
VLLSYSQYSTLTSFDFKAKLLALSREAIVKSKGTFIVLSSISLLSLSLSLSHASTLPFIALIAKWFVESMILIHGVVF